MSSSDLSSSSSTATATAWDKPFQTSRTSVLSNIPCVSLFTRHGRVGCSTTDRMPSKGYLVHAATLDSSIQQTQQLQPTWFVPPLVLVIDEDEFHYSNIQKWKGKFDSLLEGILVLSSPTNTNSTMNNPAASTPFDTSSSSSSFSSYSWNPWGDDLLNQDLFGISIFYITDTTNKMQEDLKQVAMQQASHIIEYHQKQQQQTGQSSKNHPIQKLENWQDSSLYPAMIAQVDLYMGPSIMDSITCLGWKDQDPSHTWNPKCLPIGGNSIWATPLQEHELLDIVLVSTNMDGTSMFHDLTPSANTAASNLFVLLMSAKFIGQGLQQQVSSKQQQSISFSKQIVFTAFQGELFGQIGSMSFLQDIQYPGFHCDVQLLKEQTSTPQACLHPLRHDVSFTQLLSSQDSHTIDSMIALDQVGLLSSTKTFYLHDTKTTTNANANVNNNNNNNQASSSTATTTIQNWKYIFQYLSTFDEDGWKVMESSIQDEFPPFGPLYSLHQLSNNSVGGVLFTGYDSAFLPSSYYMSHLDSNSSSARTNRPSIDLITLAKASTFLARAIVAYATLDTFNTDYEKAVQYAMEIINPSFVNMTQDKHLLELSHCLFVDGSCDLFLKYGKMQQANTLAETGMDLGLGSPLGTPPNYYPSIYDASNGQGMCIIIIHIDIYILMTMSDFFLSTLLWIYFIVSSQHLLKSVVHGMVHLQIQVMKFILEKIKQIRF